MEMTYACPLPPNPNSLHCPTNWALPTWLGLQIPSLQIRGSKGRGFAVKGLADRGLAEKGLEEMGCVRGACRSGACTHTHTHALTDPYREDSAA